MTRAVILYSTDNCPHCRAAKKFFEARGIKFEEKNVEKNKDAREEMFKKSHQFGVPVIDIGDAVIVGFDRPFLKKLFSAKHDT